MNSQTYTRLSLIRLNMQETLPVLLYTTGWFQERIWAWFSIK